ncbi:DksA/TraR family C4-type zinc finger protein [Hyphomonas sp.]|jgi:phage/conjugal plasmid C-4 type zinc finger TraR family protein|uniref:DksA/TraR family C4-type zinc finger protein n=1 Tax=Hyphomonas sp. TaxID=87 RepID=UPI0039E60A4E
MASGWARDGAIQDQIDDSINDAVQNARARMPVGESATHCDECEEPIPARRREALPGVRTCVSCQSLRDKRTVHSGINRRGSKDSQLR